MISVRAHFGEQAAQCRAVGSPFTGAVLQIVLDGLDRDLPIGQMILDWTGDPQPDALALRVAGGLHGLVLSGTAPALAAAYPGGSHYGDGPYLEKAVNEALRDHGPTLMGVLANPPQTNEVARAGVLAGGFFTVAAATGLPLALLEIGASGGLNLLWDHYRYKLGGAAWGDGAATLCLRPAWQGPPPPCRPVTVTSRAGCDRNPVDLRDPAGRLRLRSYIWADQADRLSRMDAAMAVVAQSDLAIDKADAIDWLGKKLANRPGNAATVLFHSVFWQYLPAPAQERLQDMLVEAGKQASAEAPLAWLRMEANADASATDLKLTLWPRGGETLLARADYHGRWVEWHGAEVT
ncbi:MAG: DUF2332 domain-containing protein [Alphaproteobacteria bacterium]